MKPKRGFIQTNNKKNINLHNIRLTENVSGFTFLIAMEKKTNAN